MRDRHNNIIIDIMKVLIMKHKFNSNSSKFQLQVVTSLRLQTEASGALTHMYLNINKIA